MKRVAAAVGDGSTAIRLIHDYLALAPPYAKVNESRWQARKAIRRLLRNAWVERDHIGQIWTTLPRRATSSARLSR